MKFYGMTDRGVTRSNNQDNYTLCSNEHSRFFCAALCDGMGGANGGEIASAIAVDVSEKAFSALVGDRPKRARWGGILKQISSDANAAIYKASIEQPELSGMGTTFVALMASESKATVANIGDSRAYLISEDGITQLTTDHSLVHQMVEKGEISAREAKIHPSKNVITRALGVDSKVECDVFHFDIKHGQHILLCSDGLTADVSEPEIHFEVQNGDDPQSICTALINLANARGGRDNITVVLAAF